MCEVEFLTDGNNEKLKREIHRKKSISEIEDYIKLSKAAHIYAKLFKLIGEGQVLWVKDSHEITGEFSFTVCNLLCSLGETATAIHTS